MNGYLNISHLNSQSVKVLPMLCNHHSIVVRIVELYSGPVSPSSRSDLQAVPALAMLPDLKEMESIVNSFLDILFLKKSKLHEKENKLKRSKKQKSPSAFRVNYLQWLKSNKGNVEGIYY